MTGRSEPPEDVLSAWSLLFVPGSRPDRFAKAAASGADLVVCDLEDGVAPDQRAAARNSVGEWLFRGGRGVVRCNAAGTSAFEADVAAVLGADGLAGLLVPRVEDPAVLGEISARVGPGHRDHRADRDRGRCPARARDWRLRCCPACRRAFGLRRRRRPLDGCPGPARRPVPAGHGVPGRSAYRDRSTE